MPAIDRLMKKLGYVKLSAFGLVLTPDGRVLSMRPAVLDDGLGGKIVGWQDGDLAAAELEPWGAAQPATPARPAPRAAVATRVAPPAVPAMVMREAPMPPSVAPIPTLIKPAPPAAPAPAPAANVAPPPPPEEDDWEWTIAIARARAAAEDAEQAAASAASAAKKATAAVPAPPRFAPATTRAAVKTPPPLASGMDTDNFPKTEPLHTLEPDDFQQEVATEVVRVVKAVHTSRVVLPAKPTPPRAMPVVTPPASAQRAFERARSPVTVIPVPKLPSIAKTPASHVAPVVKNPITPMTPVTPLRPRLAKGTGPYLPKTGEVTVVEPEPPPLQPGGEDTVPHLVLPPVARASRA
jgi:hypothetical protein